MRLFDMIKNKIINVLDPDLTEDYKKLQNNHNILEQEYSKLGERHDKLKDNYEYALYSNDENTQTIKKLEDTNENLKTNIANKILQTLKPKLEEMTLGRLEFLYKELNYEDIQLKEIYSKSKDCEEIYLSRGELIDEVSEEILGDKELWDLFPEEDARGTFEFINGYDSARWREKYHFGKVVNIEHISCYEFCTYKLDYSNREYVEYKKKLYREVIPRELKKYMTYILKDNPNILSNTEEYLEKLEEKFTQEKVKQKEEKTQQVEYNKVEESQDEEEM